MATIHPLIEQLAKEHLADTDGTPEEKLRRLGAKLGRYKRALWEVQDQAAAASASLRSLADTPARSLAGEEKNPKREKDHDLGSVPA